MTNPHSSRPPAEWRTVMTEAEAAELARLEQRRDEAAEALRRETARLKARCIKRLRRAG